MKGVFRQAIGSIRLYSELSYIHHVGKTPLKHMSLGKLLELTAIKYPNRDAVISVQENKKISYTELLHQADRFAAGLKHIGVEYGDRVGLWAPNILEWNVTAMACARAGFVAVTINPGCLAQEILYCINKVGIKTIVCPEQYKTLHFYEILSSIITDLDTKTAGNLNNEKTPHLGSIITISENKLRGTFSYDDVMQMANDDSIEQVEQRHHLINPDNPVNIQFTSGTTGKPKAAIVSHYNVVNNSLAIGERNELNKKHHKICVLVPYFHTYGYTISIAASTAYGSTLVIPSATYNSMSNLQAIKEEKCTTIHGTPTMYVDLINVQQKCKENINPEIAVTGGAPCSPDLFKKMQQFLNVKKINSVYGLSEATSVAFQSTPSDDSYKSISTVGLVEEHLEVKVVDENNNVVPIGTPGELCIRGYSVMLGYWDDLQKTKEAIDNHGWLRTGDQFILENDGYGKIVGRLKDMIIRGGENIFPKEIEDFLNTHPDIIETHVIGIPHERLGEEVCACVRLQDGAKLSLASITEFCNGKLAKYKLPTQLHIVNEFPKTRSGKIQKFLLKERFDPLKYKK